jgi:hypothetical protein|tara:strand:+ start:1291 stop:2229 length:939 start_codon:yes stop_codon:yes gene_type:complete
MAQKKSPAGSYNQVTAKNKKGVKAPKVDLSRLAMAKQVDIDQKEYQTAQEDLQKKQKKRGWWKGGGQLLGGAGGGWLGGLLGAGVTGALALTGPVGWMVGAAATGLGAGLGSYAGGRKGIEGGERFDKGADTRRVQLKGRPRVSGYGQSALEGEKRSWNQAEQSQLMKSSIITGLTAGADKYLKLAKAGKSAEMARTGLSAAPTKTSEIPQELLSDYQSSWGDKAMENLLTDNPQYMDSYGRLADGTLAGGSYGGIPMEGLSVTPNQGLIGRTTSAMRNYQPSMPGKGIANWLKGDKQMSNTMLNFLARRGG